jgi:phospholipid/cholesterol/gamma-HCH transport system substrate-binding protein
MKQTKKTEVKVGISLLVSIVILLFVIAWSKNVDIFSDKKELTVSFDSVAGLEIGDQVTVNGVRKGYVDEIIISGNEVDVKLIMDEDVQLKEDASFSIMMLDLMGGKKVEITPGISDIKLDFSLVHSGSFSGDISTTMAKLGSMEENFKTIIDELTITLNAVNNIIADDQFSTDLKSSANQINQLTGKVSKMVDENRKGFKSLIDSSAVLVSNTNQFLMENRNAISRTLDETNQLLNNSNTLITSIQSFLDEVKSQDNNAGKFLYDEKLYTDLKTSLDNLKELTTILIEQLKDEGINVDANIF